MASCVSAFPPPLLLSFETVFKEREREREDGEKRE